MLQHNMMASVCILFLALSITYVTSKRNYSVTITLGGVLSSREHELLFIETVFNLNSLKDYEPGGVNFNATTMLMDPNPIRSALAVCDKLLAARVSAVVVSHPPHYLHVSPISVSYTCNHYKIPVIGIAARDSAFSDSHVHGSFVRTVPPYSHQAFMWVELLEHFDWKKVVFVHSTDEEGWSILHYFRGRSDAYDIEIEKIVRFPPGLRDYTAQLSSIVQLQSRVILLYATEEEAEVIYRNAGVLNLTGEGWAWIVTEQALQARNVPVGVIGGRLINSTNEKAHIQDSVNILANTFRNLFEDVNLTLSPPPSDCGEHSKEWQSGPVFFDRLMKATLNGQTGQVSFDKNGDRMNPVYEIVNIHKRSPVVAGIYGSTQLQQTDKPLDFRDNVFKFMGNTDTKPTGVIISKHLRIVTMEEDPFVYNELMGPSGKCTIEKNAKDGTEMRKVKCTHIHPDTGKVTDYCCWGYCIDLAFMLANSSKFTFDVTLSQDGYYGSRIRNNETKEYEWNGMIGELVRNEGDMIIGALTMTPERAQQIEFTQPYKYLGLKILMKKASKESSLASFLQPFQDTLWILVGLSVHVVALVLYLLDRFSPFGRFKLSARDEAEEDALNLSSAMWFSWGVLLNSGIGEGTPRSFSARVLGMVWAGFAMIIIASYTANLAAFLVLDRPEASITGITDPRLRNPTEKFRYATVKNSGADMYFKRQVDLSTMARTMEDQNYDTAREAIADLKADNLQAFIWDSPRLEYEAARDCDLLTAGELFGRSGFSIGLQKKSPWTKMITKNILQYHEAGLMEKLDTKWILLKGRECPKQSAAPATLGLTNMAGVFMMVAGGIVGGALLISVEIMYRRHQLIKEKQTELARRSIVKWRSHIEKKRALRETREFVESIDGIATKYGSDRPYTNHQPPGAANHYVSDEMLRKLHRQREEMRGMKPARMPSETPICSAPVSGPPPYDNAIAYADTYGGDRRGYGMESPRRRHQRY